MGPGPDPERERLAQSIRKPTSIDEVAEAVAAATEHEHLLYVERSDAGWRWSLVHRGGAYPLLRIYARFLKQDHHTVVLPFAEHASGLTYIPAEKGSSPAPLAGGLLEFARPVSAAKARQRILEAFGLETRGG